MTVLTVASFLICCVTLAITMAVFMVQRRVMRERVAVIVAAETVVPITVAAGMMRENASVTYIATAIGQGSPSILIMHGVPGTTHAVQVGQCTDCHLPMMLNTMTPEDRGNLVMRAAPMSASDDSVCIVGVACPDLTGEVQRDVTELLARGTVLTYGGSDGHVYSA